MTETIYTRAIKSAFQNQLEAGVVNPELQLKTVERRMRQLPDGESGTFSELLSLLLQGLFVILDGQEYVAQVDELQKTPSGGLVKRLSRIVDKKTRNPKTSRGTVWRRNSTVKERRRISPNWRFGSTAQLAAKRKSTVQLFPAKQWTEEKEISDRAEKQQRQTEIKDKQNKRNRKKALIAEYERRMEIEKTEQELLADRVMTLLDQICEKKGIAQESELYRRLLISIESNQPLPVLFVWGPPYEQQGFDQNLFSFDTPEKIMANEIEYVFDDLATLGLDLQPILLFADTYGTQINGLTNEEVSNYYQQLEDRFNYATVTKWSEVVSNNQERYDQLEQKVLANLFVTEKTIENAQKMQAKLGFRVSRQEAEQLAIMYTKERTVEGVMLEEGFFLREENIQNVIKLGTAPNRFRNDESYEASLPRIYIKGMTRAAWNTAR